MAPEDNQKFTL